MAAKKKKARHSQPPAVPPASPLSAPGGNKPESAPPGEGERPGAESPRPPVAGIGASAGGLDAFKKLLTAMPADSGIATVLIPHLDPTHESMMVELLARHSGMPVEEAVDGTAALANHVYIIPPNKYMTIIGGVLRLTGPVERTGPQTAIDVFMRSLAEDKKEKAICIILSGTGAHGTLGLKAVKAAGGLTMVQDPATAGYPLMPLSAIATGMADYVLPVEQMPQAIIKYIQHYYVNGSKVSSESEEGPDHLNQVLALLRARTKLDFRCYRKKMLARRIERRMSLSQFEQISDYLAFLREHPDEVKQLSRDLLISVTSFFRDVEAWSALEKEVIVPLVDAKEPDSPLRVWSVGCATGEEPYSLGIQLLEELASLQKACPVQIFASDVDEEALETARQGTFPESISADVSPARLGRFFTRVSETMFQVSKQLREIVTFARQNVLTDAPFSKLDLVVCRNLLIYLSPEVQKRVIELLHFSLNEGGYLFLGPSETIGRKVDLFEPVSVKWRIYRRIGPTRATNLQFPALQVEPRPVRPHVQDRPQLPPRLAELAQSFLLRRYALACVVINRNYEVLHFAGPTEDYLIQPGGPPTHDLLALARPGLETKLRVVIQRAIRQNTPQSIKDVMMQRAGITHRVNIEVEPLTQTKQTEGLLLISFQEQPTPTAETKVESRIRVQTADLDMVRQLEQELETTREDLQSTIEELESSNEELKASNEEIMSMNEELQSANEELETSKEELQSLNEELSTVNNQLQDKVHDLETINNDIANLLNCTDIATVFLDTALRIKRFTPSATELFKLIATDVGRPIGDVVRLFIDEDLQSDSERLLRDLTAREKEVRTHNGRWCVRRILPYRTLDNRIDGVVITFVDITERKFASDAAVRRLAAIVETSADAIFSLDLDGTIRTWNAGAERIYGYTALEALGQSNRITIPKKYQEEWSRVLARLTRGEHIVQLETERIRKDGQLLPVALTYSPLQDSNGKVVGISIVARDITERKRTEISLRDREERLRTILSTAADAIITIDRRGIIQEVNPATEQMFGYPASEMLGQNVKMLMPLPYAEEHDRYLARYQETREKHIIGVGREMEARRKDGNLFPVDLSVSEVDSLNLFTGILRDITRRKDLERQVVEIASVEQRRIGQDLHDTVAQELTALTLQVGDLAEALRTEPTSGIALVEQIARGLQRSQQAIRAVLRGLLPVAVDSEGLMSALADLTDRVLEQGKVNCTFTCPEPVSVPDNLVATHLYLIGQEAVYNAIKHAHAVTIHVRLNQVKGSLILRVQDDGCGMSLTGTDTQGLGLRVMRNRAAILGARLTIEPAEPSGTIVTCILPRGEP